VLTASYEARPYGVRSAIPLYQARMACPELIVVPPDMQKYRGISREIFEIFRREGRAVEGLSMDEAFVAVGVATLDEARAFAAAIRREVFESTQLTVSAGVATAKMVAKIASDSCKPDGLLAVAPGEEAAFLAPNAGLALVGHRAQNTSALKRLRDHDDRQLAALDDAQLRDLFGSWFHEVRDLASRRRFAPRRART